jgi:hypothetical protein
MAEMDTARLVKGSVHFVAQSVVATMIGAVALAFVARILTQVEMGVTVGLTLHACRGMNVSLIHGGTSI